MSTGTDKFLAVAIGVLCLMGSIFFAVMLANQLYRSLYPEPASVATPTKGFMYCECYQRGRNDVGK